MQICVVLEKVKQNVPYVARKNWENQKKLILLFICIPESPGLLVLLYLNKPDEPDR